MLKRTPLLALVIAFILTLLIINTIENPSRPFTPCQTVLLYFLCFLTSMGIAMLFDPNPKKAKEEFLKINFYEEKR